MENVKPIIIKAILVKAAKAALPAGRIFEI